MPLNCVWVFGTGGAGGVVDRCGRSSNLPTVILVPRRPVSLFSFNLNGPSRFIRLGNASAAMYRRARKHKLYRTRLGVPDPDFSPPFVADARNKILGPEAWENDRRKHHGVRQPPYSGATPTGSTELRDRPLSVVPFDHSSTRDPRRRRRRDEDEDEKRVGDTDSQLSNQARARHRA